MKVYTDCEQRDLRWLRLHIGKVTGSEAANILTPEFKPRIGEVPRTYLASKVAEAYRGEPLPQFNSFATDQGIFIEEEVKPWYELEYGVDIQNVAFVEGDDQRCGCSPDGLVGEDEILEIKSPQPVAHVKYLLAGELPKDYAPQVHFSLYVTGRKRAVFVSYRRHFPALVLTINRDEAIMRKIEHALKLFYAEFDAAMEQLKAMR